MREMKDFGSLDSNCSSLVLVEVEVMVIGRVVSCAYVVMKDGYNFYYIPDIYSNKACQMYGHESAFYDRLSLRIACRIQDAHK